MLIKQLCQPLVLIFHFCFFKSLNKKLHPLLSLNPGFVLVHAAPNIKAYQDVLAILNKKEEAIFQLGKNTREKKK